MRNEYFQNLRCEVNRGLNCLRRKPEAEVKRVPGAGHSVQGDRQVELRRTIAAFGWGTPGRGLTPRARVTRWHRMVLPRR